MTKRYILGCCSILLLLLGTAFTSHAAVTALDGFNPNVDGPVYTTVTQSDGKILVGGLFSNAAGVARSNIARLNADGSVDTSFAPSPNGAVETIAVLSDGSILIGGDFTAVGAMTRNHMAKLDSLGSLDANFNPDTDNNVYAIAVQADGKIVAGGAFTTVKSIAHNHLVRLTAAGVPDGSFAQTDGDVYAIAIQVDGSIVVGGAFTTSSQSAAAAPAKAAVATLGTSADVRRQPHTGSAAQALSGGAVIPTASTYKGIVRLTPAGTADATSFTTAQLGDFGGTGAVYSIAVHPDGSIIFGGDFTLTKSATTINRLARTSFNGVLDTAFSPNPSDWVTAVALQSDGHILIGGWFTNGVARVNNTTGIIDAGFAASVSTATVYTIAQQSDGRIIAGGSFSSVNGRTQINGTNLGNLVRFYSNGAVESEFNLNGTVTGEVYSVAVQSGGRVVIGGQFTAVAGSTRTNLARFNADGSLDSGFTVTADGPVYSLVVDGSDRILAGGAFTNIGGQPRNRVARWDQTLGGGAGAIDSFNPNVSGPVYSIAVQTDTNILIGGLFSTVSGTLRNNMARVDATGSLDSFNPNVNSTVRAMAVQGDGKIVIGGSFTFVGGTARNRLARVDGNGLPDAFDPNVTGTAVYAVAVQGDGKIIFGGAFSCVGSSAASCPAANQRNNLARVLSAGTLDATMDPNVYAASSASVNAIILEAGGTALIGGSFSRIGGPSGTLRSNIARWDPALNGGSGGVDASFNPGANAKVGALALAGTNIAVGGAFTVIANTARPFAALLGSGGNLLALNNPGNGQIRAVAFQSDGKMLVGGTFTSIGGQSRNLIARFNADGSLDGGFNPSVTGTAVNAIAVQSDGKILVGGQNGANLLLVRVTEAGGADTFNHGLTGSAVNAIAIQTDDSILVGGTLTGGIIRRLLSNGAQDGTFAPSITGGTTVNAIAVHSDNSVVFGGDFTGLVIRMAAGGGQTTFNLTGASVNAIAVQSDNKILIGGSFSKPASTATNLIRVDTSGTLDGTFASSLNPDGAVSSLGITSNGTILAGGSFQNIGGSSRPYVARLTPTGSVDTSFSPAPDGALSALGIQSDGKVVIGGSFLSVSGTPRYNLARLNSDVAGAVSMTVPSTGASITLSLGGAVPQTSRVLFQRSYTNNGTDWSNLGQDFDPAGGWSLAGQSLDQNRAFYIRTLVMSAGGQGGASFSVIGVTRYVYLAPEPSVTTNTAANDSSYWPAMRGNVVDGGNSTLQFEYWSGTGAPPATACQGGGGSTCVAVQQPVTGSGSVAVSRIVLGAGAGTYTYRLWVSNSHYSKVAAATQTFSVTALPASAVSATYTGGVTIPASGPVSTPAITIPLSGTSGCPKVTDVNVVVAIAYPDVSRLAISLHHDAVTRTMLSGGGSCTKADMDVTMDDSAGTAIGGACSAGAPPGYTGSFRPVAANPLSDFNGINNAQDWVLTVTNSGPNTGTILGWGVVLTCASQLTVSFDPGVIPVSPDTFTISNNSPLPAGSLINCTETCPTPGTCTTGATVCSHDFSNYAATPQVVLSGTSTGNWDIDSWTGVNCNDGNGPAPTCTVGMIDNKAAVGHFVEIADFIVPAAPVYAGYSYYFDDNSRHATSWSWDFGDGTSTAQNPGHAFASVGSKTVTLKVNNVTRFSKTKSVSVEACSTDPAFPLLLGGLYYATVADAYAAANAGDTVAMLEGVIPMGVGTGGVITIDRAIILDGGYFCGFVPNPTYPSAASAVSVGTDAVSIEGINGVLTIQ